ARRARDEEDGGSGGRADERQWVEGGGRGGARFCQAVCELARPSAATVQSTPVCSSRGSSPCWRAVAAISCGGCTKMWNSRLMSARTPLLTASPRRVHHVRRG